VPDQKAVGFEMRRIRMHFGISLRAVARELTISAAYLSDLELGKRYWAQYLKLRFMDAVGRLKKM
jgi:predicted transcriptional regulator